MNSSQPTDNRAKINAYYYTLLSFDVTCYAALLWQYLINIVIDNLKVSMAYTKNFFSPLKVCEPAVAVLDLAEIDEA